MTQPAVPSSRLTQLDTDQDELSHRFPYFLPDEQHYTFTVETGTSGGTGGTVYFGQLGSDERTLITHTNRAPIYAEPGYLIFGEDGHVVAQNFDSSAGQRLGNPHRLAELIPPTVNTNDRVASVSETGLLMLPSVPEERTVLSWLDRNGRELNALPLPPGNYSYVRISPDGNHVAMQQLVDDANSDVWVPDIERGTATRVTFEEELARFPICSPDSRRVAFHSNRNGPFDLFAKSIDGSGEAVPIFSSPTGWKNARSWSHGYVAFETVELETGYDIWIVPDDDPGAARPYLVTSANESAPAISPDGRWLAYISNESGRFEVYVQSFPETGIKYQVTRQGAESPFWPGNGRELFCLTNDGALSTVPVTSGNGLTFGAVQALFPLPSSTWAGGIGAGSINNTADGQRFAVIVPENPVAQTLVVVMNWELQLEN